MIDYITKDNFFIVMDILIVISCVCIATFIVWTFFIISGMPVKIDFVSDFLIKIGFTPASLLSLGLAIYGFQYIAQNIYKENKSHSVCNGDVLKTDALEIDLYDNIKFKNSDTSIYECEISNVKYSKK